MRRRSGTTTGGLVALLAAAGCGPGGFGRIGDVVLAPAQSAAIAWHQDGRGMVVLSDMPDLCEQLADNPSDLPAVDEYWVASVTSLEPLTAGVSSPAEGFARIALLDGVTEHLATEAALVVTAQDAAAGSGSFTLVFDQDRIQRGFTAELCATSALFIGKEVP